MIMLSTMIPDSLPHPSKEFADSLFTVVNQVGDYTNEFSGGSLVITIVSLFASLVTILGLGSLFFALRKRRINKACQTRILMDMIRHMFTNSTISEVIRLKMSALPKGATLKEGVMERYCFLDSDIELSNLNFSAKSYEKLHSIKLRLKNYNSVARIAEKHFTDPKCPDTIRLADLDDLWERSIRLTEGIIQYAEKVGLQLDAGSIRKYIIDYHNQEDYIPKWIAGNKLNNDIVIPKREALPRSYYDGQGSPELTDIFDKCMRYRYGFINFVKGGVYL